MQKCGMRNNAFFNTDAIIQRSCLLLLEAQLTISGTGPTMPRPKRRLLPFRGPILLSRFNPPTAKANAQLPYSNVESALHRSPPGLNHRPKRSYPFQLRLRLASLTIRVPPQNPRFCFPLREPCRAQLHIFARAFRPSWQVDMLHEPHVPGPSAGVNPRAVCPGKRPSFLSLRRFSSPSLVDSGKVNEPTPEQLSASKRMRSIIFAGRARDPGCQMPPSPEQEIALQRAVPESA
ncbi:hypothetical protein K456DRAFT_1922540 [Colletotrichum gloeosporioides 23]|nr:hypothetical protein K456DRAFT_1922540 [Colletotrichum gloeosporioides 23]